MRILQKITQRIKWKWHDMRYTFGFGKSLTTKKKRDVILVYHGIDAIGSTAYNTRFISEDMFEKQVAYFAQNTHVVSLEDFFLERFSPNKMNLASGILNINNGLPLIWTNGNPKKTIK